LETTKYEPVIIGVAEVCQQLAENLEDSPSLVDLLEQVVSAACADTGAQEAVIAAIDSVAMVRTFADSTPMYPNPFGKVVNYPRAVAGRVGAEPLHAIYSMAGGNTPQSLLSEFAGKIAAGDADVVVLMGGEAIATTKTAMKAGVNLNWADDTGGQLEDRGLGMKGMLDRQMMDNGFVSAPLSYGLLENARRQGLGLSREDYAQKMAALFSRFSGVAAAHEASMFPEAYSPEQLLTIDQSNPMIAEPYPKHLVAKDGVNQAAAVILTSREKAEALGVSPDRMVFPLSGSTVREQGLTQRPDLGKSEAMRLAYEATFTAAGLSPDDMSCMDIYSCFPIAVFSACDALGIAADDKRGLTLTGGLPFFGGAGNNYAMHSIVNVVKKLREQESGYGLVGANGGMLSKHAVGIYSRQSSGGGWRPCNDRALQATIDGAEVPAVEHNPDGQATIESYTVTFRRGVPNGACIIGRTGEGKRFLGHTDPTDSNTPQAMLDDDPIGKTIYVTSVGPGNRFTFDEQRTRELVPARPKTLDEKHEYCTVARNGPVLEVTINRPDARNSLNAEANYELEGVFDLFEEDPDLWVAIITGAGDKAFCAGADLKSAAGTWIPDAGFGGLTHRKHRHKPVIAAVNGIAMGGGMEIALTCELVIASENSHFALSEVKRGVIAGAGGIQRITRSLPRQQAMEILLTGDNISPQRGQQLGFVNQVVPPAEVMTVARALAQKLTEASPTSISCTLQLEDEVRGIADIVDAVRHPAEAFDRLLTSEDMLEGLTAFAQKRPPQWKGR